MRQDGDRYSSVRADLLAILARTGLGNAAGKLLYSGVKTVEPGELYLLGFNPGGDPNRETQTVERHLLDTPPDWNEYVDAEWFVHGRPYRPGEAPMQKRVRFMLRHLGFEPRAVCASNLIFARSRTAGDLGDDDAMAAACWPMHEAILGFVRPKAIVTIGKGAFDFIRRFAPDAPTKTIQSGHGGYSCYGTRITLQGRDLALVAAPHLARYKIDNYPDAVEWLRSQVAGAGPALTGTGCGWRRRAPRTGAG